MPTTSPSDPTFILLKQLVRALDEKKATDLRVLEVGEKSSITDYLVLATGTSEPHLRALRIEVERVLDAAKQPIAGMEVGTYGSGWMVVDGYQVMTHLFLAEQRANYALEKLWKDAVEIPAAELLSDGVVAKGPKKAGVKKKASKKVATKKPAVKTKGTSTVKKKATVAKKRTVKKK